MTFAQRRHCSPGERIEGHAAALTLRGFEVNLRDNLLATSEHSFDDWGLSGCFATIVHQRQLLTPPNHVECQGCGAGKWTMLLWCHRANSRRIGLNRDASYKLRTYKKLWLPLGEKLGIVLPTTSRRSGLARRRSYLQASSVFARRGHEFVPVWGVPCRDA